MTSSTFNFICSRSAGHKYSKLESLDNSLSPAWSGACCRRKLRTYCCLLDVGFQTEIERKQSALSALFFVLTPMNSACGTHPNRPELNVSRFRFVPC